LPCVSGAALSICLIDLGWAAAWSRALPKSASSVCAIELAAGERFAAQLAKRRYVKRFRVALPVQGPVRRTALVPADMLGEEPFRALRIWALWGKPPQVAAKRPPASSPAPIRRRTISKCVCLWHIGVANGVGSPRRAARALA